MRPPGGYRTESSVTSPCREPSSQFIVLLHFQIIPCGTSPAPPTSSSTLTRATYSTVDSTICLADSSCRCYPCSESLPEQSRLIGHLHRKQPGSTRPPERRAALGGAGPRGGYAAL